MKEKNSYKVSLFNQTYCIKIIEKDNDHYYVVDKHDIGRGTRALLNEVKSEVIKSVPISSEEWSKAEWLSRIREELAKETQSILKSWLPNAGRKTISLLAALVEQDLLGSGMIEVILEDPWIEDVTQNGIGKTVSVYHRKYGWLKTEIMYDPEEVYNLAAQVGRRVGKEINVLHPIMNAHLISGDRLAATLFPISAHGPTVTFRRFAKNPWTITHLIDPAMKVMSIELAAILWQVMEYELNLVIAGGTASGKTTVLNALANFLPQNQRVISIEDTREISLPDSLHWNWVPLTSREPNLEGLGGISMLDLTVASLRMRPDRIIVGEIREAKHAHTMFEAMHTGHSVYATIHADTAIQLKDRLIEPPFKIPKSEAQALQLMLIQYRDRRKNVRKSLELVEVLQGSEDSLELNTLFRWQPRNDSFERIQDSVRMIEELNLHTGMTPQEIKEDQKNKEIVLGNLVKKKIFDIDKVGYVIDNYYKDKNKVIMKKRNERVK